MKVVPVVTYCRTGIARATRGALNQTNGIPMTAHVLRHAVKRPGMDPAEVEDVVVGCGLPEGATGHNIARNAALEAGFGDAVPGMTVNRYCGSGLSAASIVANRSVASEATIAIAAGVESISLVQFNLTTTRRSSRRRGRSPTSTVVRCRSATRMACRAFDTSDPRCSSSRAAAVTARSSACARPEVCRPPPTSSGPSSPRRSFDDRADAVFLRSDGIRRQTGLEGLGRGTGARYQGGSGDPEVARSTA